MTLLASLSEQQKQQNLPLPVDSLIVSFRSYLAGNKKRLQLLKLTGSNQSGKLGGIVKPGRMAGMANRAGSTRSLASMGKNPRLFSGGSLSGVEPGNPVCCTREMLSLRVLALLAL